jgi:hypothetical protein
MVVLKAQFFEKNDNLEDIRSISPKSSIISIPSPLLHLDNASLLSGRESNRVNPAVALLALEFACPVFWHFVCNKALHRFLVQAMVLGPLQNHGCAPVVEMQGPTTDPSRKVATPPNHFNCGAAEPPQSRVRPMQRAG